jgi:prepilin-type processing-associated H-X9-DG protein
MALHLAFKDLSQNSNCLVNFFFADGHRRHKSQDVALRTVNSQPLLKTFTDNVGSGRG